MEPVRELDDDDAVVVGHGDEHLAQILELLALLVAHGRRRLRVAERGPEAPRAAPVAVELAVGHLGELGELRDLRLALDDGAHVGAERRLDLLERDGRVLDGVVEQARRDGLAVHAEAAEQARHGDGVDDEGLAGAAHLARVRAVRDAERVVDERQRLVRLQIRAPLLELGPVARHGAVVGEGRAVLEAPNA